MTTEFYGHPDDEQSAEPDDHAAGPLRLGLNVVIGSAAAHVWVFSMVAVARILVWTTPKVTEDYSKD